MRPARKLTVCSELVHVLRIATELPKDEAERAGEGEGAPSDDVVEFYGPSSLRAAVVKAASAGRARHKRG